MQQAVTGKYRALHSAPCYSERFGYKFCSRLYLNGDGSGLGTHISVFFVVLKGECDALLKWPFDQRFSLKLLNPDDDSKSITKIFIPDGNQASFGQPTEEMNIAAGFPLFIAKDLLWSGDFIIDDSIFIETTILGPDTPVSS